MDYTLGVDIGGTKMLFAVVNADGVIIEEVSAPTPSHGSREEMFTALEANISKFLRAYALKGVGMGVPGILDVEKGVAIFANNLPSLRHAPVTDYLKSKFNLPFYIDNDVRVAVLGEKWFGAGQDVDTLICITLGTGVGSGIILKNKLWRGAANSAGEIGAIKLREEGLSCTCGITGSLESIASGPAIATAYEKITSGSLLQGTVDTKMPATLVADLAKKGDVVAIELFRTAGHYLGIAVASYVNIINPQRVIIGGGLAGVGEMIFKPMLDSYNRYVLAEPKEICDIVPAGLGNKAGVIGAASMVLKHLNNDRFWI